MNASLMDRVVDRLDSRGVRRWGAGYVYDRVAREEPDASKPVHLHVCVADHYEPNHKRPGLDEQRRRVAAWLAKYPAMADKHRDHSGRAHVRSFFFPIDEYRPEFLDSLAKLCGDGYGDVEVHLHHEGDTAAQLHDTLANFAETVHREHGLLHKNASTGKIEWAFIHGNWALNNSHPEGKYCGVDDELSVLIDTGCYADMTMPSAPSPTQTPLVNSIYYAVAERGEKHRHERGPEVCVGGRAPTDKPSLMMIQGPLAPNLRARKFGIVPRLESGELSPDNHVPAEARVPTWFEHAAAVRGAPNHRFLKLHAHGTQPGGEEYFLAPGGGFDRLLTELERYSDGGRRYVLHYVTAREMYDTIRALESGALDA